MQVVKLIIILTLFNSYLYAQINLEGNYTNAGGVKYITLVLEKGNKFKSTFSANYETAFISEGYYLVIKDTLLLFYDSLPSPYPPSKFTIITKSDSVFREFGGAYKIEDDVASISFIIQDYNGHPITGCSIGFMNSKRLVFGKVSDKNGKAEVYTQGKNIESIAFHFLGYQPIWVDMKEFWGFKSTVKVELGKTSNVTYNKNYKIEKYYIKKSDKSKLSLHPINGGNMEIFVPN